MVELSPWNQPWVVVKMCKKYRFEYDTNKFVHDRVSFRITLFIYHAYD